MATPLLLLLLPPLQPLLLPQPLLLLPLLLQPLHLLHLLLQLLLLQPLLLQPLPLQPPPLSPLLLPLHSPETACSSARWRRRS